MNTSLQTQSPLFAPDGSVGRSSLPYAPLPNGLLGKIEALRERLDTFTVVDPTGELVGEVRNLSLYNQQLHLVIVQPDSHQDWRFILLNSQLVRQVNRRDRTIVITQTHAEINSLPAHEARVLLADDPLCYASIQPSTSPLPGAVGGDRTHLPTKETAIAQSVFDAPEAPKVVADAVETVAARSPDAAVAGTPKK